MSGKEINDNFVFFFGPSRSQRSRVGRLEQWVRHIDSVHVTIVDRRSAHLPFSAKGNPTARVRYFYRLFLLTPLGTGAAGVAEPLLCCSSVASTADEIACGP